MKTTQANGKLQAAALIGSVVAGSGLMYLFDPSKGARRRSVLRDKATSTLRTAASASDEIARDLRNRAQGSVAELWSTVKREPVSDEVLEQRVRAKIGRAVSHPSAIDVTASNGLVRLTGPILREELDWVIPMVRSVRGVQEVDNQLDSHEEPGDVPGLQGGKPVGKPRFELAQENWAPAPRLLVAAAGATAMALAWRRPMWGIPLALTGSAAMLRAISNRPLRSAIGLARRRAEEAWE
jgi:osmotically-inducible protein OsmY